MRTVGQAIPQCVPMNGNDQRIALTGDDARSPRPHRGSMRLRCEECGTVSEDEAKGWRAMIVEDVEGVPLVVTYCPDCAWREPPDDGGISQAEA